MKPLLPTSKSTAADCSQPLGSFRPEAMSRTDQEDLRSPSELGRAGEAGCPPEAPPGPFLLSSAHHSLKAKLSPVRKCLGS